MKTQQLSKQILALILIWSCSAKAGEYTYSELQMKTYDEMLTEVKNRVQAAEKSSDDDGAVAKAQLRDALQLIFSRPNIDNMVSQLVPTVRTPLRNLEAYETTVRDIANNAMSQIENSKAKSPLRATSFIVLENIMSELKPDLKNSKIIKDLFIKIRDKKIEISDEMKSELRLRGMIRATASPSDTAKKIIETAK